MTQHVQLPLDLDSIPGGRVVLIAEDSDNDFLLLRKAFQVARLGQHQLIHVCSGDAAITYLKGVSPFDDRQRWPFPDLLLLDGKMPGASGFDVLRFLAEHQLETQSQLPAVVLSGSQAPGDLYKALELGAAEFILKPCGMNELLLMVQTIHYRWLAHKLPGTPLCHLTSQCGAERGVLKPRLTK